MRKTERYPVKGANSLWQVYRTVSFWKVFKNTLVIVIARYIPFMWLKNWLYRTFLRMEVGEKTAVAFMVMMDILYPEKIRIGRNSIIGYNSTILTHEYLIDEYRLGEVTIGNHVMIGANTTILPGVTIGDHAVIGAGSVVTRDVPPRAFAAGNPIRLIRVDGEDGGT
ncbi:MULTISPECIES: DapH/DapD/GlmU-related protein [Thermoactinomyces]|jgi:acetyltransferase-like isoleucine patch superfamily enzyme|uniref:Acyltransferase n=1 Tax=Thermoactinomyces daqus TaxID=1329516 RepID=A0A7W1XAH2_9BACL|nr:MULTISPECIES: acyltransferase [Thermoactinomyces]MBA4543011.1 acyltransferase [Thermoactinomyces daqus]MBH8598674.1 acyltransferase [Thermoactinomyces sp. CICC 10523]MBH8605067.1 acyltransferase [Thermoactinomyces sp. CICC 10522]MBH8606324.1 acyltransferase [Thermoactinomyces sp. CICC 10521]